MNDDYKLKKLKLNSFISHVRVFNFSWLIFIINLILLLAILFPWIFRRFPVYSVLGERLNLPYELELYGRLVSDEDFPDFSNYAVYIGGYKQNVQGNGEYAITFLSDTKNDIMVVVLDENHKQIWHMLTAYNADEYRKNINIKLGEPGNGL